jgi:hypothetical protein
MYKTVIGIILVLVAASFIVMGVELMQPTYIDLTRAMNNRDVFLQCRDVRKCNGGFLKYTAHGKDPLRKEIVRIGFCTGCMPAGELFHQAEENNLKFLNHFEWIVLPSERTWPDIAVQHAQQFVGR